MSVDQLPPQAEIGIILGCLKRHAVDFLVVGGLAGLAHGSSYPTYDVDVAYSREPRNLDLLVDALREMDASLRGAPADVPFQLDAQTLRMGLNFTFDTRFGPFDILGELRGVGTYERVVAAADSATIEGVEVNVISLDHLIAMKSAAGREKDRLMVNEYVAIADELRRMSEAGG